VISGREFKIIEEFCDKAVIQLRFQLRFTKRLQLRLLIGELEAQTGRVKVLAEPCGKILQGALGAAARARYNLATVLVSEGDQDSDVRRGL
jgi:hypothetical protein